MRTIESSRSKANGDKAKVAGSNPMRIKSSICNHVGGAVGADSTAM
jgi:hypothetical protein